MFQIPGREGSWRLEPNPTIPGWQYTLCAPKLPNWGHVASLAKIVEFVEEHRASGCNDYLHGVRNSVYFFLERTGLLD
jgi:hypothetical protein